MEPELEGAFSDVVKAIRDLHRTAGNIETELKEANRNLTNLIARISEQTLEFRRTTRGY